MILGIDSRDLARQLFSEARSQIGSRLTYKIDPGAITAAESARTAASVPMLTAHGASTDLAKVIHSFHQWGQPIYMGIHCADGLFEFWVERDDGE